MVTKLNHQSALKKWFPQMVAGFSVTLILIQLGISSGWTSPYISKLEAKDSPIPLNSTQSSWVASLLNLGRFIGAFVGAVTVNYFGCKTTLLITLFPMAACWSCTIVANNPEWLYVSRLLSGIALGMTYSSFPLYVGEVSIPKIRGAMVSLASCGATFGVMVGNIVGSKLPMDVSGMIYLVPCLILILIFAWLPESPHHLLKYNKIEAARASINWYRSGHQVEEELEAVRKFVANATSESFYSKLGKFRERFLLRATLLVACLYTYMQVCGFNSVLFYMESILKEAQVTVYNPATVVNFVSVSGVFASALSILLIDRFGRRCLLIVSSIGVTIAMAGLGTHFHLIEKEHSMTEELQWLPIISLLLFELTFFFGLVTVPNTVMSEVFPTNVKCIAACIGSLAGAFFAFVATKSYQPLINWIGQSWVFYMYAIVTITAVPYALIFMPETKGKTLQQIQDKLLRR